MVLDFDNNAVEITTYDNTDTRNRVMHPTNLETWISKNILMETSYDG